MLLRENGTVVSPFSCPLGTRLDCLDGATKPSDSSRNMVVAFSRRTDVARRITTLRGTRERDCGQRTDPRCGNRGMSFRDPVSALS